MLGRGDDASLNGGVELDYNEGPTRGLRDPEQDSADVGGANWGYSTTTFGDGDYGTPGAPNGTLEDTPPEIPNSISIGLRTTRGSVQMLTTEYRSCDGR